MEAAPSNWCYNVNEIHPLHVWQTDPRLCFWLKAGMCFFPLYVLCVSTYHAHFKTPHQMTWLNVKLLENKLPTASSVLLLRHCDIATLWCWATWWTSKHEHSSYIVFRAKRMHCDSAQRYNTIANQNVESHSIEPLNCQLFANVREHFNG